jgi:fibronectin type 3 domain-containing protein
MKNFTLLFCLMLSISWFHTAGQNATQNQVRFETDANSGQFLLTESGTSQPVQQTFTVEGMMKEAGINWQFTDDAAVGSKTRVSSQTGQTFTSWWLNDQRISMYGNSSSPLWEAPVISDWEWPVDMTEDGEWVVSGSGNTVQVYMESSSAVFWELTMAGNVMGVKLNPDGTKVFVADNNHDGLGNAYVSAYTVGESVPEWEVPFTGDGTVFTASRDGSRLVFCQYSGYNKMWVMDGANGDILFDAFYANQNPPGLSNDGSVIVNGDYSGNVYLYKYDETLNTYEEKWTFKVGGGGTSVWVVGMGVSGDGATVAVGSLVFLTNGYDGEIYLFNSWSPVPLWVFSGTGDEVSAIDLSEDGSLIAAASWGPLAQNKPDFFLFRKESDSPILSINTPGSFFSVDISDDGTLCAVTGKAVHAREFGSGGFLYNIDSDPDGGIVSGIVDLENTTDDANAKVVINELEDYFNRSKPDGSYQIKYVPEGTYTVTASKIGYYPETVNNVVVTEGVISEVNFNLEETGNPPYSLMATHGSGLSVDLSWQCDNPGDLLGYNIYRKSIAEDLFPEEPLATVSNDIFTYSDFQVLPLSTYYYAVTAIVETDVESPYSNVAEGWMSSGFVTDNISVYVGSTPVIDGTITAGEWDDAFELDASDFLGKNDNTPNPVGSVTMYFKNNAAMTELYVACINENDVVLEDHDEVALYMDDNHDGVFPAIGDSTEGNYWAAYYASGSVIKYRPIYNNGGVGATFYLDNPQIAVSNATGHIVYEFVIPIGDEFWDINPGPGNASHMFSFTLDDPTAFDGYWPCTNPQIFVPIGYGEITYSAMDDVPVPPSNLDIWWNDEAPYTVLLEWDQPSINDFDHFNVYTKTASGNWEFLMNTIGTQIMYISSDGAYREFYVTTVDQGGQESVASEIAIFDITIGIGENKDNTISRIFPNPTAGQLNISIEIQQAGNYEISIRNIEGRLVKSLYNGYMDKGSNTLHFDEVNSIQSGIYTLTIKGNGMNVSQMVMLINK